VKKTVLSTVILLFGIINLHAQLLWELSGRGIKTSYLFGTHHLVSVDILDSVPNIYKAFNRCSQVAGEVAIDDHTLFDRLMQAAVLPDSMTLSKLLSDRDYQKIDSAFISTLNMPLSSVGTLKPAFLNNIYLLALYEKVYPQRDDRQLDSFFQHAAKAQGRNVIALESVEKQIDILFESQSLERQAYLLAGAVEQSNRMNDEIRMINQLYRAGKIESLLEEYLSDTSAYAPTLREKHLMLDERNHEWVIAINRLIKTSPTFIAVGALHLAGENGLIALLSRNGVRVKPVK
jgi:uncharacterized protein YbaP (TraB family)